ncbi:VTT domain-containing protein [Candidatus Micrarchaeota archaeon]|nr:VTT domain-containing protein [Candidatus Micrarchaeota archaeon]
MFFDVESILVAFGYTALFAMIFVETGLLVGFFLPGDTLLFTAGILAAKGILDPWLIVLVCSAAAIAGDSVGYWIGRKYGKGLFDKEEGMFFKRKNLETARAFYEKHGGKTIFLARFVPVVRTFAPVLAGVGEMKYSRFLAFNVFGGIFWVAFVTVAGYFIGGLIPNAAEYTALAIVAVVVLSLGIPALMHLAKKK